jgi:hypothetical protein
MLRWAEWCGRKAETIWGLDLGRRIQLRGSVVEVVGQGLIEDEVRGGLSVGRTLPHAMHASRGDPGSKAGVWSRRKSA